MTATGEYIVVYDAACEFCRAGRAMLERMAPRVPIRFVDANDRGEVARLGIDFGAAQGKMHVVTPRGDIVRGFDAAVVVAAAAFPLARLVMPLLEFGPIHWLGERAYQGIARNRRRLHIACACR